MITLYAIQYSYIFHVLELKIASRMGVLKGKPLYLDAQATTPLVSILYSIINMKYIFLLLISLYDV